MAFESIYAGWRARLEKLSDEQFETTIDAFIAWFEEGLISDNAGNEYRREWVNFMLQADPILTDDGLAGFMEAHVPQ